MVKRFENQKITNSFNKVENYNEKMKNYDEEKNQNIIRWRRKTVSIVGLLESTDRKYEKIFECHFSYHQFEKKFDKKTDR